MQFTDFITGEIESSFKEKLQQEIELTKAWLHDYLSNYWHPETEKLYPTQVIPGIDRLHCNFNNVNGLVHFDKPVESILIEVAGSPASGKSHLIDWYLTLRMNHPPYFVGEQLHAAAELAIYAEKDPYIRQLAEQSKIGLHALVQIARMLNEPSNSKSDNKAVSFESKIALLLEQRKINIGNLNKRDVEVFKRLANIDILLERNRFSRGVDNLLAPVWGEGQPIKRPIITERLVIDQFAFGLAKYLNNELDIKDLKESFPNQFETELLSMDNPGNIYVLTLCLLHPQNILERRRASGTAGDFVTSPFQQTLYWTYLTVHRWLLEWIYSGELPNNFIYYPLDCASEFEDNFTKFASGLDLITYSAGFLPEIKGGLESTYIEGVGDIMVYNDETSYEA